MPYARFGDFCSAMIAGNRLQQVHQQPPCMLFDPTSNALVLLFQVHCLHIAAALYESHHWPF
jgi:hypothetical protein